MTDVSSPDVESNAASVDEADEPEQIRVWMVERTFSADSPNIMVITYATTDGEYRLTKEWAYNRFGARNAPTVTAALEVEPDRLTPVDDDETGERYASEAKRMRERHEPDESV
ncbi:hypothetical protein [Halobiforma nitratireducens]|uniref:DUF7967 domain-containing protein n=1 Tax=Halobiforma nitratireducens JCM 10879 TaxID=1227454 RepID=M0MGI9_9EURY|nr:hypothetical protein [Halobiforma nitratireducens]EMA43510.1 hypothetical protein C446_03254 [Halobiforma nitratireducens JCM 10879]